MWWLFVVIIFNFTIPTGVLYDQLGFPVAGFRATPLDILIFLGPLITFIPGWRNRCAPVLRTHPAFLAAMCLFVIAIFQAALVGLLSFDELTIKYYFQCLRNLLILPFGLYMGYQILGNQRQVRMAVMILVLASVVSAICAVVMGGEKTSEMANLGTMNFDAFRETRDSGSGDFGMMAAGVAIFSMVSGIQFGGLLVSLFLVAASALGTLFISHRSSWLSAACIWAFAAFYLKPSQWHRKIVLGSIGLTSAIVFGAAGVYAVENYLGREGYTEWVVDRLSSLLPDQDASLRKARAWDTRTDGLLIDLQIWGSHPLLGGGFGIHEANALRTGDWTSFRHTPWTSTLAESGPIGFAAFAVTILGMTVVGIRLSRTGMDRWTMLLGAALACYGLSMIIAGMVSLSWNSPRAAINLAVLAGITFRAWDLSVTQAYTTTLEDSAHTEYGYADAA